jgi:hypothetical protein
MNSNTVFSKNTFVGYGKLLLIPATLPALLAAVYFVTESNNPYWDFYLLLMAIAGLVCTVCCYIAIANIHHITTDDEKLVATSWLGYTVRTIYLKDITGWYELHKFDKQQVYISLVVYTRSGKYIVKAKNYNNYPAVKQKLTNGVPVAKEKLKHQLRTDNKVTIAVLAVFAMLCVYVAITLQDDYNSHAPVLLGTVTGVLDSEPEVIISGRHKSRSIEIKLKEYPGFDFVINDLAMKATDAQAFVTYARRGYPIQLTIPVADYEAKFAYLRQPTFWEKHMDYYHVDVAGFKDSRHTYLDPVRLNSLHTDHTMLRILAAADALVCMWLAIKGMRTGSVLL